MTCSEGREAEVKADFELKDGWMDERDNRALCKALFFLLSLYVDHQHESFERKIHYIINNTSSPSCGLASWNCSSVEFDIIFLLVAPGDGKRMAWKKLTSDGSCGFHRRRLCWNSLNSEGILWFASWREASEVSVSHWNRFPPTCWSRWTSDSVLSACQSKCSNALWGASVSMIR
jgi:hypothetical protein